MGGDTASANGEKMAFPRGAPGWGLRGMEAGVHPLFLPWRVICPPKSPELSGDTRLTHFCHSSAGLGSFLETLGRGVRSTWTQQAEHAITDPAVSPTARTSSCGQWAENAQTHVMGVTEGTVGLCRNPEQLSRAKRSPKPLSPPCSLFLMNSSAALGAVFPNKHHSNIMG